jgi:hypothetical protein
VETTSYIADNIHQLVEGKKETVLGKLVPWPFVQPD